MADFGLPIDVLEQGTNTPIVGATVTGTVQALDASNNPIDAVTDAHGRATIAVINVTIRHPDYLDYVNQPYRRPSLQAPVAVHLAVGNDEAAGIHLEQRGNDFVDANGQRVVYPGVDGFDDLYFRVQGREAELDALLAQTRQLRQRVRRIWCMGDAGENQVFSLSPQTTPRYIDTIRSLVAYENGYGVIPLFTCFVDAQRVMPAQADRQRFWRDLNDGLRDSGAYLMSGGNQHSKNGFDPWADLADPGGGVIWSRGSDTDDVQTRPAGAPASELHATRNSFDRALMDATASPPEMRKPQNGSSMVWMTEGNPFGDAGGYSDQQAWQLWRAYSILWSLAVFHDRQSQRGQLMHDDTARCAAAAVQGMAA
jgi:hypothetical protein